MKRPETTEFFLCADCVADDYLSRQIEEHGALTTCSYCEQDDQCFAIEKVANLVEASFQKHYERTSDQPTEEQYWRQHADPESTYIWYREGESLPDILQDIAGMPEEAACHIQDILYHRHCNPHAEYEQDFDTDALYESTGISDEKWQDKWQEFERIVKTESRFFSKKVYTYLNDIFSDLDRFKTYKNKPLAQKVGPDQSLKGLYRARVFQDRQELLTALKNPDQQIGTPSSKCAKGGRMNAPGIAVFYGATNSELAIAEVRPPVGSRVVVGKFLFTRELRLLNIADFKIASARGNIFDPDFAPAQEKALFLKNLAEKIAMPVMPSHESHEYLPTQIISDFLAEGLEKPYDGIIFPSTQSKAEGYNVVLFHRASRVEAIEITEGSIVTSHPSVIDVDIDEYESYNVIIQKPAKPHKKKPTRDHIYIDHIGFMPSPRVRVPEDPRETTLRIVEDDLQIFEIGSTDFKKSPFDYKRTTIKKRVLPEKEMM